MTSFLSAIFVGRFFDTIGRKFMILTTCKYLLNIDLGSGIIIFIAASIEMKSGIYELIIVICFILASPASSSANLIASEIFPTKSRSLMMSLMFITGIVGGIVGIAVESLYFGASFMSVAGILGYILIPNT